MTISTETMRVGSKVLIHHRSWGDLIQEEGIIVGEGQKGQPSYFSGQPLEEDVWLVTRESAEKVSPEYSMYFTKAPDKSSGKHVLYGHRGWWITMLDERSLLNMNENIEEIEGIPGLGEVVRIHPLEEDGCYVVEYEDTAVSFFYWLSREEGISFHFSTLAEVAEPLRPAFETFIGKPVWVAELVESPCLATIAPMIVSK